MIMASPATDSHASFATSGIRSPIVVRSRTHSVSSDRPSTIASALCLPPVTVSPNASYVAHSAASQIITNDLDSHADAWCDQNGVEPARETAAVSSPALNLVNGFLDQLLFNFLQTSQSTALSALRPAVVQVLKPKLAEEAISNADEELSEYLGGSNGDELAQPPGSASTRDWDLELVWKRTRLRCMVYSSLGDMEEEDEDTYMEEGNLEIGANDQSSDVISPAAAIFLTSLLEFMGELTLTVAGQVAYQRVHSKIEKELQEGERGPSEPADRIVVSEADMERVALDRTLGRLWRGWKKRMRTATTDVAGRPIFKALSIPSEQDGTTPAHDILGLPRSVTREQDAVHRRSQDHLEPPILEDIQAADVPLPISANDVEEIEVPGLAHYSDDETDAEADEGTAQAPRRPKSLVLVSSIIANGLPTPLKSQPQTPLVATRKRSMSLPTPRAAQLYPRSRKQSQDSAPESEAGQDMAVGGQLPHQAQPSKPVAISEQTDIEDAEKAGPSQSDESEYEDSHETVAVARAHIMTSSRVSLSADSSYSSDAVGSGKVSTPKRSSSVPSARIIDVSGPRSPSPRSPAQSRPDSLVTTTDRPRPESVTANGVGSSHSKSRSNDAVAGKWLEKKELAETRAEANAGDVPRFAEAILQQPGLSLDSASGLTAGSAEPALVSSTSTASVTLHDQKGQKGQKGPPARINTAAQVHTYEWSPSSAKAPPLPTTPASAASFESAGIPDLPRKAPGHATKYSPKPEGKGLMTIERSRTRESDEASLPLQGSARQVHTSASSVSSAASRLKPVRRSEDGSSRSESMARQFDELIRGGQTITYTLTPENMRDIDSKTTMDGPVMTKFARRKSEDARAHGSPKLSATVTQPNQGRMPPLSPTIVESKFSSGVKPSGPIPRAPTGSAPTGRENGPLARDARVPKETTMDFADFIKSTGPGDESKSHPSPRLVSPPLSPGQGWADSQRTSTNAAGSANRLRHQPRDATVDSRTDNSDLIDFIRQGPPIAPSNHRIPRHVAPFRTTMDSDQMSGAIGGKAIDAVIPDIRNSLASTNATDNSVLSMESSVNSKSALLRRNAPAAPGRTSDAEDYFPKRKTRRVRDPYSLDFSDEEDNDDDEVGDDDGDFTMGTPRPAAAKMEESLAEFLRNYDPPQEPASAQPSRVPKKKASAPSLIGRFGRGGKDKEREKPALIESSQDARTVHSRGSGRGYIPIQVHMPSGYDTYGSFDQTRPESRIKGPPTVSTTAGRVPMKRFQPRDPVSSGSQTADLAAFFRDSAPPPDNVPMAIDRSHAGQEEGGSISKMFGRRKKSLAT